jgi:regulator of protease activity HflC (stomatin/prohibitin superfamily)
MLILFLVLFIISITSVQVLLVVQRVLEAENMFRQIEVEARQAEQQVKGVANAAIARAEGQAKAAQMLSQSIKDNPEYLRYLYIDKLARNASVIVVQEGMTLTIPSK